jgi:hypothetical protein
MIVSLEIKHSNDENNSPRTGFLKANYVKDELKHDFQNIGMSGVFVLETFEYHEVVVHKGFLGTIGGGFSAVGGGLMNVGGAVIGKVI